MQDSLSIKPVIVQQPNLAALAEKEGQFKLAKQQETEAETLKAEQDIIKELAFPQTLWADKHREYFGTWFNDYSQRYIDTATKFSHVKGGMPLQAQLDFKKEKNEKLMEMQASTEQEKYYNKLIQDAGQYDAKGILDKQATWKNIQEVYLNAKNPKEVDEGLRRVKDLIVFKVQPQTMKYDELYNEARTIKTNPFPGGSTSGITKEQAYAKADKLYDMNAIISDYGNKPLQELKDRQTFRDDFWGMVDKGSIPQAKETKDKSVYNYSWGNNAGKMQYTPRQSFAIYKNGSQGFLQGEGYAISQKPIAVSTNYILPQNEAASSEAKSSGMKYLFPSHVLRVEEDGQTNFYVTGRMSPSETSEEKQDVIIPYFNVDDKLEVDNQGLNNLVKRSIVNKPIGKNTTQVEQTDIDEFGIKLR